MAHYTTKEIGTFSLNSSEYKLVHFTRDDMGYEFIELYRKGTTGDDWADTFLGHVAQLGPNGDLAPVANYVLASKAKSFLNLDERTLELW